MLKVDIYGELSTKSDISSTCSKDKGTPWTMRWIECKSQNLERRAMQCSLWFGSDKSMTTMNTQRLWLHAKKEKHGTRKGNKEKGQQEWVRRGSAGVVMEKRVNWKRIWLQPFLFTHRTVINRDFLPLCSVSWFWWTCPLLHAHELLDILSVYVTTWEDFTTYHHKIYMHFCSICVLYKCHLISPCSKF